MTLPSDIPAPPSISVGPEGLPADNLKLNDTALYYLDRNFGIVVDGLDVLFCACEMFRCTSAPIRGLIMTDVERWLNGFFGSLVVLWFRDAPERYFDQAAFVAVESSLQLIRDEIFLSNVLLLVLCFLASLSTRRSKLSKIICLMVFPCFVLSVLLLFFPSIGSVISVSSI
jgi:hypothetical protein